MWENLTILIKRFFLISNVYIKTTIAIFILAVLINSGLLLFIPGLHIVQYPTIALLITIIAYFSAFGMGFATVRFKDGKATNFEETSVFVISTGLIISIVYTFLAINGYAQNTPSVLSLFFMYYLLALSIAAIGIFLIGSIRFRMKIKESEKK